MSDPRAGMDPLEQIIQDPGGTPPGEAVIEETSRRAPAETLGERRGDEDEPKSSEGSRAMLERIAELERELASTRERLGEAERRGEIDRLLLESGAVDLEIGRVMTEQLIREMRLDDAAEAVEALRRSKPLLFERPRGAAGIASSVMTRATENAGAGPSLESLAAEAAESGGRRELARYLRARRGA